MKVCKNDKCVCNGIYFLDCIFICPHCTNILNYAETEELPDVVKRIGANLNAILGKESEDNLLDIDKKNQEKIRKRGENI